uniref:Yeast HAP4 HAP4 transcriptional activator n=1 Tax=Saccharomyces cerevisiae TaxID=4932 RepID=A2NUZ7_YEASX|nr:unnamed protein product [Saccharomyces cerevisiae]
MLSTGPLYT